MDRDPGVAARDEVLDALSRQVGVVLDRVGKVVALTPSAHEVLGGRLTVGVDFVDLVLPDDRALALALVTSSPLDADTVPLRCAHLDGSWRVLACRSRGAADGELVICADDVTSRERARAEIAMHGALVDVLQGRANVATLYEAVTRFAEAGAPGSRAALYRVDGEQMALLAGPHLPNSWARVAARIDAPEGVSDVTVVPGSGRIAELAGEHGLGFTWIAQSSSIVLCAFVGAKRFLTAAEHGALTDAVDLTSRALVLHEDFVAADDRASLDRLTGVLGRQAFFDALEQATRPVTLMLVHVGGVAAVNAAHGYEAGDATLRAVALALQGVVRRRDAVGRLSGAIFAIAGPSRYADRDVERWADRVREAVHTRLVAAGRVLEPDCRVTHVIGPPGLGAAEIVLQAEAQLRGSVTGLADRPAGRTDAASGRGARDR